MANPLFCCSFSKACAAVFSDICSESDHAPAIFDIAAYIFVCGLCASQLIDSSGSSSSGAFFSRFRGGAAQVRNVGVV